MAEAVINSRPLPAAFLLGSPPDLPSSAGSGTAADEGAVNPFAGALQITSGTGQ